jgi:hypothetical protein
LSHLFSFDSKLVIHCCNWYIQENSLLSPLKFFRFWKKMFWRTSSVSSWLIKIVWIWWYKVLVIRQEFLKRFVRFLDLILLFIKSFFLQDVCFVRVHFMHMV